MYRPSSLWTWSFVLISLVQAFIVLGFECYVFGKFQSTIDDDKRPHEKSVQYAIPTFLALYIFGFIYQLILVYDALRLKNTIQVIGLCMFNVALLIYAAVQMDQIKKTGDPIADKVFHDTKPYLIAIPCILALGTVLMTFVARKLYDEFAWTIYKHISADLKMKRRYLTFQIYITLLKFDFFLFLGFTIQFVVIINNNRHDPEVWLTIAAIPITIIILIMAGVFCRRESRIGMALIIALYHCALAYFIFKLARIYQASHKEDYLPARRPLTTFAVITIILIVCTIINAIVCTLNFGKGLKPHIAARKVSGEGEEKWDQNEAYGMPPARDYAVPLKTSRMELGDGFAGPSPRNEYGAGVGPGGGMPAPFHGGYVPPPKASRMTID